MSPNRYIFHKYGFIRTGAYISKASLGHKEKRIQHIFHEFQSTAGQAPTITT